MSKNNFLQIESDVEVRLVIPSLWFKNNFPIQIYRELKAVYGPNVISVQSVRKWYRLLNSSRETVTDNQRSGRPSVVSENLQGSPSYS